MGRVVNKARAPCVNKARALTWDWWRAWGQVCGVRMRDNLTLCETFNTTDRRVTLTTAGAAVGVQGLGKGQLYCFTVVALNSVLAGAASPPGCVVTVPTPPGPPPMPGAPAAGADALRVTLMEPSSVGADLAAIAGFQVPLPRRAGQAGMRGDGW